jgi:hypothetical protein
LPRRISTDVSSSAIEPPAIVSDFLQEKMR